MVVRFLKDQIYKQSLCPAVCNKSRECGGACEYVYAWVINSIILSYTDMSENKLLLIGKGSGSELYAYGQ